MNVLASRVRKTVESLTTAEFPDYTRVYSIGSVGVAVIAEPEAIEWCDHYLAPSMAASPLGASTAHGFVVRAIHDRLAWEEVRSAVGGEDSTDSQTYNGTRIREWKLDEGLYVQQYVTRKSFTITDVERRTLTFVDDCLSDTEWWMEPSRLVREAATRELEEESNFVFHAASIALGGKGAAIIGPKRAGKTTLTVAALEYANAAYIANDRTYFELESGAPYVRGWPVTAAFGIGTCLSSPTMRALLEEGFSSRYPQPSLTSRLDLDEFRRRDVSAMMQERVKIELTPLEIGEAFGVPVVARNSLDALIFPKLDPACDDPEFRVVTPAEATTLLSEQSLTCDGAEYRDWLHLRRASDEVTRQRASEFVDQLVHSVPAYSVRYWNAASVAQVLGNVLG